MFCQRCGTQLAAGVKFCPVCGAPVVVSAPPASGTDSGKQAGRQGDPPPIKTGDPQPGNGYARMGKPAPAARKKKPVYKRAVFWVVIVLAALWAAGQLRGAREQETVSAPTATARPVTAAPTATARPVTAAPTATAQPAAAAQSVTATPAPPTETPEPPFAVVGVEVGYYGAALSGEEQIIYTHIVDEIGQFHETFPLRYASPEEVESAYYAVFYDHPELFWIDSGYYWRAFTEDGVQVVECTPVVIMPLDEARQRQPEIQALVSALVSYLADQSEYETALMCHDYLTENTAYDYETFDNHITGTDAYDAYGCLMEHKALCAGYAKAFQWLMQARGIECLYVTGYDLEKDPVEGAHAWNCAKLDGEWYHIDVTWDDSMRDSGREFTIYDFFCITSYELLETHGLTDEMSPPPPECTATACDYYRVNDMYFDTYDYGQVAGELAWQAGSGAGCCMVKFASEADCAQAEEDFGINGGFGQAAGIEYYLWTKSKNGRILQFFYGSGLEGWE